MRSNILILFCLAELLLAIRSYAQDYYASQRSRWLSQAEALKPSLQESEHGPVTLVELVADPAAFQGWRGSAIGGLGDLYANSFKAKSGAVFDFGEHLTGHFTFDIKAIRGVSDAPLRFKLTFGEVPAELATPFDPYNGTLSRAWLQDEVVTVMELPASVTIDRRVSFRYVKIELLGSSRYFDFAITGMKCRATTAVSSSPGPLAATAPAIIKEIDRVGLATLKECMQTVYEDGPKRDQRLWIGDLYLESISNIYAFRNHALTKRCLYLLAGLSREDGFLNANVFETPVPHPQAGAPFLFDYSLLYNVALYEYVVATGDVETARDLWPLAKKQLDNVAKYLTPEGLFDHLAAAKDRWWLFVDWNNDLDRQAAIHGIMIFAMQKTYDLAVKLGSEKELTDVPKRIKQFRDAAHKYLYDKKQGVFVSGPDRQVSYASQAWMVLSGVATKAEGARALKLVVSTPRAVQPGAPYLFHYYIEALIQSGLHQEARNALIEYWGGMVKKGADTFWEVYDPGNEFLSPYDFYPVNSYCHAWSCTPVYFIRKYPNVFQR